MPKRANNQTSLTTLGFSTSSKRVASIMSASACTRPDSSSRTVLTPRSSNPPDISSVVPVVCTPSYVVPAEYSSEVVLNPRPSNPPECTPTYLVPTQCSSEVVLNPRPSNPPACTPSYLIPTESEVVMNPRPINPPECTPTYLVPTQCSSEVVLNPRPSNPPEISSMVPLVCTPSYVVPTESSSVVFTPIRRNKATMQSDEGSIDWLNSSPIKQCSPSVSTCLDFPEDLAVAVKVLVSPPETDLGKYKPQDVIQLSNEQKNWLLKNAFRPASHFKFPSKLEYTKQRKFQHIWLETFPWLSYSISCDGGFCINCVIFGKTKSITGQLCTTPMTNFTRAKQTLTEHSLQLSHNTSMSDTCQFVAMLQTGLLSVQNQLEHQANAKVRKNREFLKGILKVIFFCGRQNIALRGHHEIMSFKNDESMQSSVSSEGNPGNFLALLRLLVESGDMVLKDHLSSAPKNAKYQSPTIQNDLINATGEWMQEKILQEVRAAKYFSVCADEASDVANKEQLSLILRFVDQAGLVREEFISFFLCEYGTTGEAVSNLITNALRKYGLDLRYLCGQGYDGAGNMAGKYQGAAAIIQQVYPMALYFHCAAHALNLCVVAACSVQSIRNMHGTLQEISIFYNSSPKRQGELEIQIKSKTDSTRLKLVNLCKTRWVARITAYETFYELLPAVISSMEVISTEPGWNTESSQKAATLLRAITQFEFLISFVVVKHGFGFIKGLTVSLQSPLQDICNAYKEVAAVKEALLQIRGGIDVEHKKWYDCAVALGDTINASPPSMPRLCKHQIHRCNTPAETAEEYYRRTISIPVFDELLSHLNSRFSEMQIKAIRAMEIVPSEFMRNALLQKNHLESLKKDLEFYNEYIPNVSYLEQELRLWHCKWSSYPYELPNTPSKSLQHASERMFPNINCLLRVICTLPVTTCECERSISVIRRLKTYLRATMGEERLSGLALMHIHYDMDLNVEEIIDIFARQHPRRMLLNLSDEL